MQSGGPVVGKTSITLDNSDFQFIQDQLVELKNKNYELAEKNRRGQADFEAAKAKICSLQLKLEEQERDFQVTSTTLRREIELASTRNGDQENKEEDYKTKYKKVLLKAKELQHRYEKSIEIVQQLDSRNKSMTEHVQKLEQENAKLLEELKSDMTENDDASEAITEGKEKIQTDLNSAIKERDSLREDLDRAHTERKIYERKGLQVVRELKRQLSQERDRADTLQKRLEELLEISSVGSWSFVPPKSKVSNAALNETLSLCSIDSGDRETVQQPVDTRSEDSVQRNASITSETSRQDKSSSDSCNLHPKQAESPAPSSKSNQSVAAPTSTSSHQNNNEVLLLEEQAALVDRLTKLQHDKWMLEEKLSYLEQANLALSEDLANKSHVIKSYFLNQALKSAHFDSGGFSSHDHTSTRKTSFSTNINHLLSDKPSFKKVVDFLKERSNESDTISKEATKKMQLMLEETLIKCIKLQENLDYATSELNKQRS